MDRIAAEQLIAEMWEQANKRMGTRPACWVWPITDKLRALALVEPGHAWVDFHDGRCAVCGGDSMALVDDHDHNTGWLRGRLCRSCNQQEAHAKKGDPDHPMTRKLLRYRRCNVAHLLDIWERYDHPWSGQADYGRLNDRKTTPPIPVTACGHAQVPLNPLQQYRLEGRIKMGEYVCPCGQPLAWQQAATNLSPPS